MTTEIAECRCRIVGWSRDPYEPHIPAQAEWEQADDCPVHPLGTVEKARIVKVLRDYMHEGYFETGDGHRECYCGHIFEEGQTYREHLANMLYSPAGGDS